MLPPDIVAKLNECAKTNFVSARDVWFSRQSIFSWLVILGLVLEGPELLYEMLSIVRSRIQRFGYRIVLIENRLELAKTFAFVGWIFIIGGLFGELRASSRIADLSASIQECSDARVQEATLEAGDAAASARTAHEEVDAVKREAAIIEEGLGKASTQLAELKQEMLLQSPRWGLLSHGEKSFIEALRPFTGQKATVVVCGQGETERFAFEQVLLDLLRKAGWSTGYQSWNGCPTMLSGGNEMFFVSAADTTKQWVMPYPCSAPCPATNEDRVARAGRALCDILRKLWIGTQAWMESPPGSASDEQAFLRARQFFGNGAPGSPAELALREPSTIFILVGPHPPQFGIPQSKKTKAKHAKWLCGRETTPLQPL